MQAVGGSFDSAFNLRFTFYVLHSHQMPQLLPLRLQVARVVRIGRDADGHLFDDLEAVAFEADDFLGIVSEEPDGFEAQVDENLRAKAVFAQVRFESKLEVGLDRVESP